MSVQSDNFIYRNTLDVNSEKIHKKDLGLSVPDGYFEKSKNSILSETIGQNKKGKIIFLSKKMYIWSAAAVIALLFVLAVYNPFDNVGYELENDILIASIIEEESDIDDLLDEYVNEELLTKEVFVE
ncbi:hypothetical protein SAMN04487765_1604 [Tenacibaculum sp. MAR_2010_89]|uniref:hypothetical protein n=1 Tax=Tenacibaculum sp. MAR_2010_89 TaxID=1250198 RepID=UPI000897C3BC|nr:hypothetical protein [Tenacibaculum sp. MAR_2010_89]SEE16130.1 hypothetical protein SAMN04487765_1604 [Tenacibaculum sp. MAR_2010_89]